MQLCKLDHWWRINEGSSSAWSVCFRLICSKAQDSRQSFFRSDFGRIRFRGKSASVRRPFTKMTWRPRFCQGKTAKILGSNTIIKIQNASTQIDIGIHTVQHHTIEWSVANFLNTACNAGTLITNRWWRETKRWKGGCKGHLGLMAMLNAPATPQWHLPLPALLRPHACGPHTLQRNCRYLPPWFQILQVHGLFPVDEDPLHQMLEHVFRDRIHRKS